MDVTAIWPQHLPLLIARVVLRDVAGWTSTSFLLDLSMSISRKPTHTVCDLATQMQIHLDSSNPKNKSQL